MATAIQLPIAEYLQTSYRPDREFIDGEIRERTPGQWEHSRTVTVVAAWIGHHERKWNILGATGCRMQVAPARVRIPDLVVLRPGTQRPILTEPPLLTIEIISPGDTYFDLQDRCRDYTQMGVQTMWIIDPKSRTGRMCIGPELRNAWLSATRLEVPEPPSTSICPPSSAKSTPKPTLAEEHLFAHEKAAEMAQSNTIPTAAFTDH